MMRIEGLGEVVAAFTGKAATIDQDTAAELSTTVRDGVQTAKQLVRRRTGELGDSIDGDVTVTSSGPAAEWGPTARHGLFVELGTSKMAPQPYLFPSLEQVAPDTERRIADKAADL